MPKLKALHGFPPDYELTGNRREIQLQVGNAVPPPLARVVAARIRQRMETEEPIALLGRQLTFSLGLTPTELDGDH